MSFKNAKAVKPSSQSFLKGALVLTVSMALVKFCGLLQKILLTNLYSTLGEGYGEFGSGIFANAYELYVPLFTLATIGFPTAVSRMVSKYYACGRFRDVKRIYKVSKPFFVVMGTACFLIMFAGGFLYVRYIDSPYSLLPILVLSPTILLGCVASAYRGYFEGLRNMTPTAISEVIEAVAKIIIGVTASYAVIRLGVVSYAQSKTLFGIEFESAHEAYRSLLSFSVAASIFGITVGSALSLLYLKIRFVRKNGDIPPSYLQRSAAERSRGETFKDLAKFALPVGIGSLLMSFANSLDAALLNRILKSLTQRCPQELLQIYPALKDEIFKYKTAHTCIWGYYSACLTILSLVAAVAQVFGTSAMPNVTNAYTKGDKGELKKSIETVIRLTAVFAFPSGIGLAVLAEPVLSLVYFSNPNIAHYGASVLQIMGIAAVFMGLAAPICSMLQGVGKASSTLAICLFTTALKVIISYIFSQNVYINICGTAIGSLVSNLIMCILASCLLLKYTAVRPDFVAVLIKPFASAVVCGLCAYVCCYKFCLNVIFCVVISAIIYILFLFILHTFSAEEIKLLLNSKKVVIILEKLHLIG